LQLSNAKEPMSAKHLKEITHQNVDEQLCNSLTSCHVHPTSMHKTKGFSLSNNYAQKQNLGLSSSSNCA
jgi:hypothetical protein